MEINHVLTETEKSWLTSQRWYHQRFDGCPHFLSFIAMAETKKEERKPAGTEATLRICFFFDGKADWYILESDNTRVTQLFLEKAETGLHFTQTLMEKWKEDEKAFDALCNDIGKTDIPSLSNGRLFSLYQRLAEAYLRKVSSSSIIDGFALGSDKIIAEKVHAHLKTVGRDSEYHTIFTALTAPVHLSFAHEAEVALLAITIDIQNDPSLQKLFQLSEDEIAPQLPRYPSLHARLQNHQQKYFWLHNNYVDGNALPLEFFLFEIKQHLQQGTGLTYELQSILSHPEENRKKKERFIEELHLPNDIVALLHYSEDFTHWQDERKKSTFFASHYFTLLLGELGRRTGPILAELQQLIPSEIGRVFTDPVAKAELHARMEGCMVLWKESEITVLTGAEVAELYEKIKRLDVPKDLKTIRGLPASLGKAIGIARIVKSAKEIGKVQKGDILVAVMTRPDYVPAMKKAAAIVTNEGGLTCHAAIVARELRLPCVIGTKFATEALCDGDRIEVDADKGEVRVLKRAK